MTRGPILIDLDEDAPAVAPQDAPAVPELADAPETAAMQHVAALAARRPSRLARWFWGLLITIVGFVVSLAAWDYVNGLIARSPTLGYAITILLALFCGVLLIIALRELAAFSRLRRVDSIQHRAEAALAAEDLKEARAVNDQLLRLYRGRPDVAWGRDRLAEQSADVLDADGLLALSERSLLEPLDARAQREVEAAARQVATVTAIVPLALADLIAALTANLRMIRRIAEIYGGRSGFFGSWRLTRTVLTHLVATGAVAVGDDLIGSVAGGGVLSKVSRRFGEGVINGALTARVGVAAMEVCRPLPFNAVERPSVTGLVKRSLTGLFQSK
ncbi:putative membrane protein [Cognatiyoonia sediminum]|uniref:Putative membrane protein n=1 Tax=Cognatiyoonia sediminum TaxID=1508389 RepID=A0A1M5NU16_9RHOB|nr:TIGR01620 family protein [Cognatiyoonia sediminum]SHG93051.1 putative membrane protein [Cognatiyoonia sediminum]